MMPIQAAAAEPQARVSASHAVKSTDMSAQRRYWRHRYGYYPRRYWGPRYGFYPRRYWGPRYSYYGYPYYYRPGPIVSFGVGPFGFRFF
jgi:hypothetical protein